MIGKRLLRNLPVVLLLLGALPGCTHLKMKHPVDPQVEAIRFQQLDLRLAGGELNVKSSDWGRLLLTFRGSSAIMYLNLTVNRSWVIRNIPVLSVNGAGVSQTMTYSFPLGNSPGQRVDAVTFGLDLTAEPREAPPAETGKAPVTEDQIDVVCTRADTPIAAAPAIPLVGGPLAEGGTKHVSTAPGFPIKRPGQRSVVPPLSPAAFNG